MIPLSYLKSVCAPGVGGIRTCSFLLMGPKGWMCAKTKGNESLFWELVERRLDGRMKAMGNNCDGIDPSPGIEPIGIPAVLETT